MLAKLFARLLRKEPAPEPESGMCGGCQQAVERIRLGAFATPCPVCGCFWLSQAASLEFSSPTVYRFNSREEFDAGFYAGARNFRDCAEKAGCDMAAFDMEVSRRKARIDASLSNAQCFYQPHPCTPSGR